MRRLIHPLRVFVAVRSMTQSVLSSLSSSSSLGLTLTEDDMEDEEHLARLLVQDTPHTTTATRPVASLGASSKAGTMPAVAVPLATPVSEGGATLTDAILEGADTVAPPLSKLPITQSRRSNDQLSRYSHVRRVMHTKFIKEGASPVKEPALEWMCCGCRTYNFVGRKTCRRCKQRDVESFKHNSPPARHIPLFPTTWTCHSCGHTNQVDHTNTNIRSKFYCGGCGERFSGVREWYCPSCHHINSRGSTQCATCYEARPHSWVCSTCNHAGNSVFFTECSNCQSTRRRLVSDSTVLCPTCRQRNDIQWEMCILCMTPLTMMATVAKLQERALSVNESAGVLPNAEVSIQQCTASVPCPVSANVEEITETRDEKSVLALPLEEKEDHQPQETEDEKQNSVTMTVSNEQVNVSASKDEAREDGTWWCAGCQVFQRRNARFCDICLKPKVLAAGTGLEVKADKTPVPEWICHACAHRNTDLSLLNCTKCQEPRSQNSAVERCDREEHRAACEVVGSSSVPGEWRCPYCRKAVDVMVMSCCGAHRELPPGYWLCTTCCSTNRDERSKCLGCGAAPPEKPWRCLMCRCKNTTDTFVCFRCGSAHPHHWQCAKCGSRCQHASDRVCRSCGAAKTPVDIVTCQHCCAPNHPLRKGCFHCRARLSSDKWKCEACGFKENEKHNRRCSACGGPRQFDMREITWVCDVCNTAVASGGELQERNQCPRCSSDRTERSMCFPSRWQCRSCGLANVCAASLCADCGQKRLLENLRTHTTCTSCFRLTLLNEQERCERCGVDLSHIISEAGSSISLSGASSLFAVTALAASAVEGAKMTDGATIASPGEEFRDAALPTTHTDTSTERLRQNETEAHTVGENTAKTSVSGSRAVMSLSVDDVDEDDEEEEEEGEEEETFEGGGEIGDDDDTGWNSRISSWMCGNCEATNLDEAEACAGCGLRRADESFV
ncbi:hypothetical protein DQ04_02411040 [Trypanosoma grayi]|uniref:hypothetical protein n=1 Tax=Trypanosoma grayi TaxID=71804 RepID=UPI0004F45038|nr:hypothetical protein DQ04_02411040 [Trypanosoma grayi]KEG11639.1 hypothetical protein DQ04_02411040 [Trypanosoma grayi]